MNFDHPNIIKIYEYSEDENNFYLILEYCGMDSLFNEI
jgi:serine/threonine protein kinase